MIEVDKGLLGRLPRTFVPALNDQLRRWDLLFPAERRSLKGLLDYLTRLSAPDLDRLFRPIKDLEARMQLPAWDKPRDGLSISDTSLLVRSPYYPRWRAEVETAFARINDALEASGMRKPRNRVIVCTLPPGLPLPAGSPWPALEARGRPIRLQAPFGTIQQEFIRALVRAADQQAEPSERVWIFESGGNPTVADGMDGLTVLSYDALAPVRKEFLRRLNLVKKDLRSADRTYEELKQLKLGGDARLSAFIRDLFLSGNGSVLFGNSFVEWGAAEAMRRAEPQVLVCGFGIRRKLKPFSSVVLFEDQSRANPVGEQDDPSSSLIDDQLLAEYVHLTAERLPAYRGRTLTIFAVADTSSALLVGAPADLPASDLTTAATSWLARTG